MTNQLNTEIIVTSPVIVGDIGRDIYVTHHAFAATETLWVSDTATIAEMVDLAFESPDLAALAMVNVDGELIPQEEWDTAPGISARVDVYIPAQKGVLRGLIRAIVIFAAVFVAIVLLPGFITAAQFLQAVTIGNFLGGLLANALVPPPSNDNGNIEAPKIYSIEGLRNRARPGEPFNLILGKRRVFPDIIVPPYQEIVGDDIYIRTGLCWAAHDIALSDFKIGETVIGNFDGVQIQPPNGLPLLSTTPTPTLIPGIISPQSFAIDLADEAIWSSRTTAPDAEEIEIILFFPEGVGWLKKGKDKRRISPPVGVEIRYRETGTATWRTTSAADTEQADLAAVGLGSLTRREMFVDLGVTFIDQFHTAIPTGNVSLIRTYDRSAPGEPFPASIKFAVPPGKQYDVEVRRLNAPKGTADVFEDITWTAMNTWKAGNPFPDAAAAVTAVRIKGSDQLSGVVDTFNGICEALVPVYTPPAGGTANATAASWSGSAVSSNGADVLLFVTRGAHQANPTSDTEIDWPAFAEFWEWCDTQGFTFDYVENTARRKGDLQQLIGSACRARILRINGLLTPVIDRAQPAGNRTILTPDNAADFVFRKSFPPEVHAIDINFANKDTNYRNDERRIYVDGYTAQTAEKFEPFNLPGVVDADLIFRHAKYFIKSSQLQVFGGGGSQDIEGRMVLRFGDRIGIQHGTLAITSESGFVKEIFTDGLGDITGFRLSEETPVNATDQFVARIRRISANAGEGDITAAIVDDLTVITTETTDTFTFTTAISPVGGPEVGALAVVGVKNNEIIDGLVQGIDALDDEAKSVNIEWTLYAPERFVEDVIPAHTPLTPPDLIPRPLTPVIDSVRAINEGIFIAFTQPPKADVTITGFAVSFRETPDAGATANWQDRPDLLPTARNFHLPAGRPGQFFDVQIVALAQGGVRSDPVIQTGIASYNVVVPPTTPVAVPGVQVGPGGSRIPVVSVSVDPELDALFETLLIERRTVADPVWRTAATVDADNPVRDIAGLTPGETYDFRMAWKNIRGAITPEVDRPIVAGVLVADDLVSTDTQSVAGQAAATVLTDIDDLAVVFGDTISAEIAMNAAEAAEAAALGYRNTTLTYRDTTLGYRDTAGTHAGNASADAGLTLGYRNTASGHASAASDDAIQTAADRAQTLIDRGVTTADVGTSLGYRNTTLTYRDTTLGYRDTAGTHAGNASADAGLTLGYRNTASGHASAASDAAAASLGYRDTTLTYRDTTFGYRNTTLTYRDTTLGYRDTAAGHASTASSDATQTAADRARTLGLAAGGRNLATGGLFQGDPQWQLVEGTAATNDFSIEDHATEGRILKMYDSLNNANRAVGGPSFSVTAGNRLRIGIRAKIDTAGLKGIYFRVMFKTDYADYITNLNRDGLIDVIDGNGAILTTSWADYEFEITVPAGVNWANASVYNWSQNIVDIEVSRVWVYDIESEYQAGLSETNTVLNVIATGLDLTAVQRIETGTGGFTFENDLARWQQNFGTGTPTTPHADFSTAADGSQSVLDSKGIADWERIVSKQVATVIEGERYYYRFKARIVGTFPPDGADYFTANIIQLDSDGVWVVENQFHLVTGVTSSWQTYSYPPSGFIPSEEKLQMKFYNRPGTIGPGSWQVKDVEILTEAEFFRATIVDSFVDANGNAIVNAPLGVGSVQYLGVNSSTWPTALEDKQYNLSDGDVITFADIGEYDVEFSALGLDPLATDEAYQLRAIDKTGTGCKAELKITTPGAAVAVTESTNATTPTGPDQMVAKAETLDATDDIYKFYCSGTMNITYDAEIGAYFSFASIETWFHNGTSWAQGNSIGFDHTTVGISPTHTSGTQSYSFTNKLIGQVTFTGTIRDSSSAGTFGASVGAGDITAVTNLDSTRYTKQTTSGTRTATPGAETSLTLVKPKNVAV